jgi:hypothetical protein
MTLEYNVDMEEATINFLHLCDAANIDSLGKISILGIFGKIFVPDLARVPVKFTIVLSLAIKDLDPARSMVQIKIFGPDSEELRTHEPIVVDLQTERVILEKGRDVNLFLGISNFTFREFGVHVLKIYFNDEEIGNHTFIVQEGNK